MKTNLILINNDIVDAEEISPDELFTLFFEKQNEKEMNDEQKKLIDEIWKGLEGAE